MDNFSPGIRALRRFTARLEYHVRLYFAQRNVAKAETELGLLGWQQAEYDAETQRQVDAIQNVEREQGALINRAAEVTRALEELAAEGAALRATFDHDYAALQAERTKAREPLAGLHHQIDALRDAVPAAERRAAELERAQREIDVLYNKLLLIQPQTPEVRDEILGLRTQLTSIPNERNEIRNESARRTKEIKNREEQISVIEKRAAELDGQMRERKALFHREDDALARKQRDLERDKKQAEAEHEQLERAKINPYREIGIVLADNNIGPMNQPQALERVMTCRAAVLEQQQNLVDLASQSAAEDRVQVQMSLAIWATMILLTVLIVTALW